MKQPGSPGASAVLALLVVLVVAAAAALFSTGQPLAPMLCPHRVVVDGHTASCDGTLTIRLPDGTTSVITPSPSAVARASAR